MKNDKEQWFKEGQCSCKLQSSSSYGIWSDDLMKVDCFDVIKWAQDQEMQRKEGKMKKEDRETLIKEIEMYLPRDTIVEWERDPVSTTGYNIKYREFNNRYCFCTIDRDAMRADLKADFEKMKDYFNVKEGVINEN